MERHIEKVKFPLGNSDIGCSLFLCPVTDKEIILQISKLKNGTAPGPDGISVVTLKTIHKQISAPLSHIINLAFLSGRVPTKWKESLVTPVYKAGDKTDTSNYRPISVINNISKIFEKCVKDRLENFLEKHALISHQQFGFRQNLGTEHATLNLLESIIDGINNKKNA